jgi:hypothetical protein
MPELLNSKRSADKSTSHADLERIAQALQGIRFGAVEVVIHDGRIVQIERKEKVRLDLGAARRQHQ